MWRTHFLYDPAARWQHGLNQRCAQLASAAFIAGKDPGALVAYLAFWTNKEAKEKQSLDAWESVRRSDLYRLCTMLINANGLTVSLTARLQTKTT